jgi:hypothetical protein
MKVVSIATAALLLGPGGWPPAAAADAAHPYDGEWSVVLACDDIHDRSGLVKGYEYTFHVSIVDGKVEGQYGAKGAPASVVYSGQVQTDGTLEIRAVGNTGKSDRSVAKVAQGTAYSYTLAGKLESSHGQAVRRELRPCTATFGRL